MEKIALHKHVLSLAQTIAKDIGDLGNIKTTDTSSLTSAINEIVDKVAELKTQVETATEIDDLSTSLDSVWSSQKVNDELSDAINEIIGGADTGSNTLGKLADKINQLTQADELLVNAGKSQTFSPEQQIQARTNIAAAADSELKDLDSRVTTKFDQLPSEIQSAITAKVGSLTNLTTVERSNLVAAVNEVVANLGQLDETLRANTEINDDIKSDINTWSSNKIDTVITQVVTDLINGADEDSDTFKELADKITALAQADKGLVSADSTQDFTSTQKQTARTNIGAIAEADIPLGSEFVTVYQAAKQPSSTV